jgi:hypothetical protein
MYTRYYGHCRKGNFCAITLEITVVSEKQATSQQAMVSSLPLIALDLALLENLARYPAPRSSLN